MRASSMAAGSERPAESHRRSDADSIGSELSAATIGCTRIAFAQSLAQVASQLPLELSLFGSVRWHRSSRERLPKDSFARIARRQSSSQLFSRLRFGALRSTGRSQQWPLFRVRLNGNGTIIVGARNNAIDRWMKSFARLCPTLTHSLTHSLAVSFSPLRLNLPKRVHLCSCFGCGRARALVERAHSLSREPFARPHVDQWAPAKATKPNAAKPSRLSGLSLSARNM